MGVVQATPPVDALDTAGSRRRFRPDLCLGGLCAYHNETLQELASGGSSYLGTTIEVDGEPVSVEVSCVDMVEGRIPPEIDRLPEKERQAFLEDMERFRDESCGTTTARESFREGFVLPSAATESIRSALGIAPILLMILAGSIVGTEYGMGTLRTVLTRGTGRWTLLSSKLVLLVLIAAAGLVVVRCHSRCERLCRSHTAFRGRRGACRLGQMVRPGRNVRQGGLRAGPLRRPRLPPGCPHAVLRREHPPHPLGYYVVELNRHAPARPEQDAGEAHRFILGSNVNNWMESAFVTVEINESGGLAEQPDALHAFLVILAYTVALAAAAFCCSSAGT